MGITLAAAIGALVHAARLGLFDMSWNMLCPGCGGVLETAAALNTLNRDHYFCAFCVQEDEPTLDQLVEVTFTVNPRIRRIGAHDPSTLSHAEYMRQIFWSSGAVVPEDIEGAIQRVTLDLMELQPGEKAAMSLTLPNGFRQDGGDERKGQRHPDRALALAFADGERLDGLGGIDQEFVEPSVAQCLDETVPRFRSHGSPGLLRFAHALDDLAATTRRPSPAWRPFSGRASHRDARA